MQIDLFGNVIKNNDEEELKVHKPSPFDFIKSISNKRIRLKRNIAERKERNAKLKASSSSFGKSVDSVKSKVVSGPSNILGKVLGFASLLLFGVTLANIFKVDKKIL